VVAHKLKATLGARHSCPEPPRLGPCLGECIRSIFIQRPIHPPHQHIFIQFEDHILTLTVASFLSGSILLLPFSGDTLSPPRREKCERDAVYPSLSCTTWSSQHHLHLPLGLNHHNRTHSCLRFPRQPPPQHAASPTGSQGSKWIDFRPPTSFLSDALSGGCSSTRIAPDKDHHLS